MDLKITYDDGEVLDALDRIVRAGQDPAPVMASIGEALLNSTRERFVTQEAPDGSDWAELSKHTKKRKRRNKNLILTEFGYLSGQLNVRAGTDRVSVGSSMIQASTLHFGAAAGAFGSTSTGRPIPFGDIPARPFVGVSTGDRGMILDELRDYLAAAAK